MKMIHLIIAGLKEQSFSMAKKLITIIAMILLNSELAAATINRSKIYNTVITINSMLLNVVDSRLEEYDIDLDLVVDVTDRAEYFKVLIIKGDTEYSSYKFTRSDGIKAFESYSGEFENFGLLKLRLKFTCDYYIPGGGFMNMPYKYRTITKRYGLKYTGSWVTHTLECPAMPK